MSIRLVIILIIHIVFLKRILSNREIMNWIYSPRITEWGKWGSKELCPINSWVCGMTSKIGVLNETGFGDTKLNAIELQCANIDWFHTGMISSATGTWGTYGKTRYCPKGFATGFQLRSVSSGYDVGAVDFRLKCTNFDGTTSYVNNAEYEPPWGVWTAEQLCPPKAAICGIQTQVKSSTVGSTSLNNVDLACCKLPEPEITETCKLEYKWQTIVFCRQAKKKCEMKFRIGIAENDTMSKFYQKLGFIVDLHVVKNNLKLKARNAYQINSKTLENIIDETEVEESRISIQLDCEGLGQQLILRCGSYQVLTNQYRCIPNRNQGRHYRGGLFFQPSTIAENIQWSYNCDFNGGNITNEKSGIEDCGDKCYEAEQCTHFTWSMDQGGTCWMKGTGVNLTPIEKYDENLVCGWIDRT